MELRAGDRVRWTRNDPGSELVNGEAAVVESVEKEGVRFRLENGKEAGLDEDDPQLRHMGRGWASTVHSFQGRTVDHIVAAMPAGNPNLTNQKAFYVAISRARDHAELVTDDARKLSEQLERATGERISALDGVVKEAAHEPELSLEPPEERDAGHTDRMEREYEPELQPDPGHGGGHQPWHELDWEDDLKSPERSAGRDADGLESWVTERETEPEEDRSRGPEREPYRKRRSIRKRSCSTWTSNYRHLPSSRPTPGPPRTTPLRTEPRLGQGQSSRRDSTVAGLSLLLLPAFRRHPRAQPLACLPPDTNLVLAGFLHVIRRMLRIPAHLRALAALFHTWRVRGCACARLRRPGVPGSSWERRRRPTMNQVNRRKRATGLPPGRGRESARLPGKPLKSLMCFFVTRPCTKKIPPFPRGRRP